MQSGGVGSDFVVQLRNADRGFFRMTGRLPKGARVVLSWLPVLLACGLGTLGFYGMEVVLCYEQFYVGGFTRVGVTGALVFAIPFYLGMFSFIRTVFSDPGGVPESFALAYKDNRDLPEGRESVDIGCLSGLQALNPSQATVEVPRGPRLTHCRHCDKVRPPRSHHCRQCGRCILEMDHHCPVVRNCVGKRNYKYFVLILIHCSLGCAVGLCLALFWLFHREQLPLLPWWKEILLKGGMMMGASYTLLLGAYTLFHFWMIREGIRTLDAIALGIRKLLLGSSLSHFPFPQEDPHPFLTVFGKSPLLWLIPVYTSLGDGCALDDKNSK